MSTLFEFDFINTMAKTIITAIIILLTSISTKAQFVFHGSYFVAAICRDGIVIGADTRQSISKAFSSDIENEVVAFYDTSQKIYPMNGYAMAVMGNATSFSDTNWRYFYIKEFRKYMVKQKTLDLDIKYFFDFLKNNYPKAYKDFLDNVLAFASFDNGMPTIFATGGGRKPKLITGYGFITLDPLMNFDSYYNNEDSCITMAKKIEKAILEYAEKNKKTDVIGGPITVLKISYNNEQTWLTPIPLDEGYCNFKEFFKAESEGRVKSVSKLKK